MPDTIIISTENSLNRAEIMQTELIASKLRFVQAPYVPSLASNRTALLAAEANFSGYPTGGYNLATWAGPGLVSTGGAIITSPAVQVAGAANESVNGVLNVGNTLTGWWTETADNVTLITAAFAPNRSMNLLTDQFPYLVQDVEGAVSPPTSGM
jgi:hypothetical protein